MYQPFPRPPIVTLCGSSRFYEEYQRWNYLFTMAGFMVFSIGFYPHSDTHGQTEGCTMDEKFFLLDPLHKAKIENSDLVFVINPNGYVGNSTISEIVHSENIGKKVVFLTDLWTVPQYGEHFEQVMHVKPWWHDELNQRISLYCRVCNQENHYYAEYKPDSAQEWVLLYTCPDKHEEYQFPWPFFEKHIPGHFYDFRALGFEVSVEADIAFIFRLSDDELMQGFIDQGGDVDQMVSMMLQKLEIAIKKVHEDNENL